MHEEDGITVDIAWKNCVRRFADINYQDIELKWRPNKQHSIIPEFITIIMQQNCMPLPSIFLLDRPCMVRTRMLKSHCTLVYNNYNATQLYAIALCIRQVGLTRSTVGVGNSVVDPVAVFWTRGCVTE